jgi:hypothetical protein
MKIPIFVHRTTVGYPVALEDGKVHAEYKAQRRHQHPLRAVLVVPGYSRHVVNDYGSTPKEQELRYCR